MMDETEDRFDDQLQHAARDYNVPPPTPRAEIWQRIEAERRPMAVTPIRRASPWRLPLAVAALLAIGVAIGRITSSSGGSGTPASLPAAAPGGRAAALRTLRGNVATMMVTSDHLSHVESFLTDFNTQAPAEDFSTQAIDLLTTTRLLLDSKRLTDAGTRRLLEDLELVLVQIATFDPKDRREELGFIADGLARNHLRTRLRNTIPAGPAIRL
jgi:hypothetical protein